MSSIAMSSFTESNSLALSYVEIVFEIIAVILATGLLVFICLWAFILLRYFLDIIKEDAAERRKRNDSERDPYQRNVDGSL